MHKIIFAILGFLLMLGCMLPLCLKLDSKGHKYPSIVAKGLGTLIPIVFCLYGLLTQPSSMATIIFIGLLFGILGDILLEFSVPVGGASFFIGNLLYIICLQRILPIQTTSIYIAIALLIISALFFWKERARLTKYHPLLILGVLIYGFLIIFMLSISIPVLFLCNSNGALFSIGTFLFFISDILLAGKALFKTPKYYPYVSLGTYYVAQFLIAMSVFFEFIQTL